MSGGHTTRIEYHPSKDNNANEQAQISTTRQRGWLLLEWLGTQVFGLLPDHPFVNRAIAKLFYFFCNNKTLPNLKEPVRFNEKLINLKLSAAARTPLRREVTDKEHVKTFVTRTCGPGHVTPTLGLIRQGDDIDGLVFPLPCVVKPTHSSQEVLHLATHQPTTAERRRMKYWLRKDYFDASREPNYKGLDRKLIIEPIIGGQFGALDDIKVMCFGGKPKLIQVDHGRYDGHYRDFYDLDGRHLPASLKYPNSGRAFDYHDQLKDLLAMASGLCAGFSFMRADFYIDGSAILVGELTSFPSNCVHGFRPLATDLTIARLFDESDLALSPALFDDNALGISDGQDGLSGIKRAHDLAA